jgi:hypothetical protein
MNLADVPEIELQPAATPAEIKAAEARLHGAIPRVLYEIYLHTNGLSMPEGFVLYSTEDIVERNATYEVAQYAPSHIAIGDDSGGRMVLMRAAADEIAVVHSDMGDLEPSRFASLSGNVINWIRDGALVRDDTLPASDLLAMVDVYLERAPADLRGLLEIKRTLSLDLSLGEMKQAMAAAPRPLIRGVPSQKWRMRLEKLPPDLRATFSIIKS